VVLTTENSGKDSRSYFSNAQCSPVELLLLYNLDSYVLNGTG